MELAIKSCHYRHEQLTFAIDELFLKPDLYLLWGVSGSGKSTFIDGLCGRRAGFFPTLIKAGELFSFTSRRDRELFFRRFISVHYQSDGLIEELDVQSNLFLPSVLSGREQPDSAVIDRELAVFEIGGLLARKPSLLSGGERQRVSVCRAMLYARDLLLLDEPFVFMEKELQDKIFTHIAGRIRQEKLICLLASHEPWLAEKTEKHFNFDNGLCFPPGRPV